MYALCTVLAWVKRPNSGDEKVEQSILFAIIGRDEQDFHPAGIPVALLTRTKSAPKSRTEKTALKSRFFRDVGSVDQEQSHSLRLCVGAGVRRSRVATISWQLATRVLPIKRAHPWVFTQS